MRNQVVKLVFGIFVFMSWFAPLHGQTTYGDTIFYDSFGQHTSRVPSTYMPSGSYIFADASGSMAAKEIEDNYYAVVDPRHIADASPSAYFWTSTSPTSVTPTGAKYYTTDHTGNANGAVMVVNAGTLVNYIYKRPITLKAGYRYRFSFWIYVVARSSQFAMEVVNSTNNTTKTILGDLISTEGVWKNYTLDFPVPLSTTNATNNVVTGLENMYSLVMGNDYYIDDILLSTLHTDPLTVTCSNDSPVCEGQGIYFTSTPTGGASPFVYNWSGPEGFTSDLQNPFLLNSHPSMAGTYTVVVTDALGQTATATTKMIVNPVPNADFTLSTNKIDSKHNTVTASVSQEKGVTYDWNFGDGTTESHPDVTHTYAVTGSTPEFVIKLTATDTLGCVSSTSQKIEVTPFIPNVFTPNNDGVNDVFMAGFEIQVFDRYGMMLYKGTSGWDGAYKNKKMDDDTYFYTLQYTDKYHQVQTMKGYVTLKK